MPSENLGGSHLQWEPSIRFSGQFLTGLKTGLKTAVGFQLASEEPPKTGVNPTDQIDSQLNEIVQVNSKMM
jgi:hypothetical protein